MTQLVILGLDGVIMDNGGGSPGETAAPMPASLATIASLSQAGVRVVVAATRPEVKRPGQAVENLHQVHNQIHRQLQKLGGSVEVFFFPGEPLDQNTSLESHANLYTDIADRLSIDLKLVPVMSASLKELSAATTAGAIPVLIGGSLAISNHSNLPEKMMIYPDLTTAAQPILDASKPAHRSTRG